MTFQLLRLLSGFGYVGISETYELSFPRRRESKFQCLKNLSEKTKTASRRHSHESGNLENEKQQEFIGNDRN